MKKDDRLECPVCRGDKKILTGIFYADRPIVFCFPHGEYGKVKLCPLCYGKGVITQEMSSALMLIFGDSDGRRFEYRALSQLRKQINAGKA